MVPSGTFSSIGRSLGSASGIPGLGALGAYGGNALSKYVGFGDYGPAVTNQIVGGGSGVTVNASDDLTGDIYYSHREFIGNVTAKNSGAGASAFDQKKFELNPGLSQTFPFLSQLASNFEMYDFQGLMFEYKPTSGENATANSLGKIMMATQYDPDAAPFLNSVQLQNYDYAASCKPSVPMIHGVETANQQQSVNMMYVRTGNSAKDKVFTDLGYFIVATEGIPFDTAGTQILGELWVTYRIKLSRANLYNSLLGLSQPLDTFKGFTSATQFISAPIKRASNAGLWDVKSIANNSVTFTARNDVIAGCYQYVIYVHSTTATDTCQFGGWGFNTNCDLIPQIATLGGATTSCIQAAMVAGEPHAMFSGFVTIKNVDNIAPTFRVSFIGTLLGTTGKMVTVTISQVPCTIETDNLL